MKGVFLLLGVLALANASAAELYRWIDKEGKVHYTDRPYEGGEETEQLKPVKEPTPSESMSYETRRAMQNFPVTLYTFPKCGSACQLGRELLIKRGIPFTEKSLVKQEDIDAFRKESGDSQLPALTVGKTWLKGFEAGQWNQQLDFAGYPTTPLTYRPPAVPASAPASAPEQTEPAE